MNTADDNLAGPWTIADPAATATTYRTGRERILETLRDRILSGVLQPGERVDLDSSAAEFGTSRTPVREACLALSQEGLVKVAQRSGVIVVGLSPETILENFAVMAALSGIAAKWAAQAISDRELVRLRELNREINVAAAMGEDITTHNWAFHREINRACHSLRLQSMLADAGRMIPRRFFALFPEHVPCSLDEHEAIVRALEQRDGLVARSLVENHFESATKLLRDQFEQRDEAS